MSESSYHQPSPADRHLKIPHLVFGLLFLGVAGIWALGASDVISGEGLTILAPIVLVAAGVIGLAASLASGRNRSRARSSYAPTESYAPAEESTTFFETDTTTDADNDTDIDHTDDETREIR